MLRITIDQRPGELRFHLEGRLAGPWVAELEHCWQQAHSALCAAVVTVDLTDVDFVDPNGERLLAAMCAQGAKFLTATPWMKSVVAEISGRVS